ncbi:MAG: rhomboid family intramembrane serine protease [Phycisphaeraceae bacterium]|nr:rhomboid family intramembrane serine protease [Phycisphaerales bacterium]MCB9861368.1 rhomboid family intramembrane serine protease [Phycisphaeraceae bacterium]
MGIADRDYYGADAGRGGGRGFGGSRTGMASFRFVSANTWIIIINVAVFLLDRALLSMQLGGEYPVDGGGKHNGPMLYAWGHFSTYLGFWPKIEVWRLVTFQFLHANFMHVFFNMFGLFIFGAIVEQHLGRRKYVAYYLVCGIFGGLAYMLLNLLEAVFHINVPGNFGNPSTPLVGASAGVFGVIVACAYLMPNQRVTLIFPPIPMKMSWMAYGYVALAMYNLIRGGANAGGEAAHLGGAIAGFFFIRNSHLLRDFFDVFEDSRKPRNSGAPTRPPKQKKPRGGFKQTEPVGKIGASRATTSDEKELDRLLAKVSESGVGSLTDSEREFLQKESARRQSSSG